METQTCIKCSLEKSLSDFYVHSGTKKPRSTCKDCFSKYAKNWRQENKEKSDKAKRRSWLSKAYGVSEEWYEKQLKAQGGGCAICGQHKLYKSSKYMCVDHDHDTGKVRGVLCHDCNTGIARFSDDFALLLSAAKYVGEHR